MALNRKIGRNRSRDALLTLQLINEKEVGSSSFFKKKKRITIIISEDNDVQKKQEIYFLRKSFLVYSYAVCFTCSKQTFVFPKLNFTVEPTYETTHNIQNNSHYPIFLFCRGKKKKVVDTGLTQQYRFELRDEASNIPYQVAQKLKY